MRTLRRDDLFYDFDYNHEHHTTAARQGCHMVEKRLARCEKCTRFGNLLVIVWFGGILLRGVTWSDITGLRSCVQLPSISG